jgi:hypothetical protein
MIKDGQVCRCLFQQGHVKNKTLRTGGFFEHRCTAEKSEY